ncbi:MAG TPA: DoxX family protein [Ktedonobacteraceae bacterium]|nr:DoxX family protein [Ktedonobacteraceae bacterium]
MSQVLNSQQISCGNTSSQPRKWVNVVLWIVQVVFALMFVFVGGMKLVLPVEAFLAQMPIPLPGLFVRFIGLCEVAGGLGLVLPALTKIRRELTPLAAGALALEMAVASIYTLMGGGGASALSPLMLGVVFAIVAYGRRSFLVSPR